MLWALLSSKCGIVFLVFLILSQVKYPEMYNFNQRSYFPEGNSGTGASAPNTNTGNKSSSDNAYKRDGVHLGEEQETQPAGGTRKGGGGAGYDVNREQEQINREQEEMQKERDPDQLEVERTNVPQPEINPNRENPGQEPGPEINPGRETPGQDPTPETNPGTSTMGSYNRNMSGAWSRSSWDGGAVRE